MQMCMIVYSSPRMWTIVEVQKRVPEGEVGWKVSALQVVREVLIVETMARLENTMRLFDALFKFTVI